MRRGAEHLPWRTVAPPTSRWARFIQGFILPFQLLRVLLEEPTSRRAYLRVCCTQAVVILALFVTFSDFGKTVVRLTGASERMEALVDEAQADVEREAIEELSEQLVALVQRKDADPNEVKELRKELEKLTSARKKPQREGESPQTRFAWTLVDWAGLLSSLYVCQWIVIALSRDHHTHLSREASLLTGLPPEDEAFTPRVRLNVSWMIKKARQRWRALLLFAMGMPVLWGMKLFLPSEAKWLFPVMVSLWGAWWFVVFTAGKSARAWDDPTARPPWFLRGWTGLFSRIPPFRAYGEWWTRRTESVFSPATQVERDPWGLSGLAVARALSALPLVKCFVRPVIPVAAGHLLRAERGGDPVSDAAVPPEPVTERSAG
ncbi:hypothetical protein [Melittangium boletus]|uniref:hypothetical protein n=1 Tax=Melittangium boletus TaxID=83453 RepID=UPI001475B76E|nr:hypothetical protein [Melittangium boletus]